MKANIRWLGGLSLVGKGSTNHWIPMDSPESHGGFDAASRPLELLLIGLGGCTGMDVLSILQKKRVSIQDFQVELEAEQADEFPKVFTRVTIKFIVYGNGINPKDVERAIELSETKYCSASAMLRHSVKIETSFEIKKI